MTYSTKLFSVISFATLVLSIGTSCAGEPADDRKRGEDTTTTASKQQNDSATVANLKVKKTVTVGDKTIELDGKVSTDKKVNFEFDNGYFYSRESERGEIFLNVRIKLSSKSKSEGNSNFLPELNIFRYNPIFKSLEYVGKMEYRFRGKPNRNYSFLEQVFDYEESEDFVCFSTIPSPAKSKYIVSVAKGGSEDFDATTVIGIIDPEEKNNQPKKQ